MTKDSMRDSWSEEEVQLAAFLREEEREWPSIPDAGRILLLAELEGKRRSLVARVGARVLERRMLWAGATVLLVTLLGMGAAADNSVEAATEWGFALVWLTLGGALIWRSERWARPGKRW